MICWSAYEDIAIGVVHVRPVAVLPITEEMWESICQRAAAAGKDPHEYFDEMIAEFNTQKIE
jgi:hypothetical protein